jgi:hypothetical protein
MKHSTTLKENSLMAAKKTPGIRIRHGRSCGTRTGGRCTCEPAIEGQVWSKRDGRRLTKTFHGKGALTAAKQWRIDALGGLRRGDAARSTADDTAAGGARLARRLRTRRDPVALASAVQAAHTPGLRR